MNNRIRILLVLIGAAMVVAVFTFPFWRPLFVNVVVDEPFPGLTAEQQLAFTQLSPTQQSAFRDMVEADPTMAVEMALAAISEDVVVPTAEQAMPQMTDPTIAATGSFIQIDVLHGASGTATIYQLPDNSRVLRFEEFQSTNGPDLHVILTRHNDPREPADVGTDYIDLGPLKGNVGNQNYAVPAEADLNDYRSVVIYCVPFQVVFSVATLTLS